METNAFLAYDLARAKSFKDRINIATNFTVGSIVLDAMEATGEVIGAAAVGYKGGTILAEHVVPNPVNVKVGETIVKEFRGTSEKSVLDLVLIPFGRFIVESMIGAKPNELY